MGSEFAFDFVGANAFVSCRKEGRLTSKKPVRFTLDSVPTTEGMHFEKISLADDISLNRRRCTDLRPPDDISPSIESDIIPMEYEGGLKTWECSLDLVRYLHTSFSYPRNPINILELGCGSALPSIYLVKSGHANRATFQDYNESVLRTVTIPNLASNLQYPSSMSTFAFIHGDWCGIPGSDALKGPFDLILSSETIYNPSSYSPLCQIIHDVLALDGIALIAAKEYYFGSDLGGCISDFESTAISFGFVCERVWQSSDSGLNRVILQLRFK